MKILWISDAVNLSTGYGTQGLLILKGLQSLGHDVSTLGWGADVELKYEGIPIYPLYSKNFSNTMLILNRYYAYDPDIILTYGDIHMVQQMIVDIGDIQFKDKWIHWLPVDGDPFPEKQANLYKELRHVVMTSQFGVDVFKDHLTSAPRMIYNAIDPEEFFPNDKKEIIKKAKGLENKFVVLFVGQNQGRKKIPLLLEGFRKFSDNKEDVVLVMHTQPLPLTPTHQGWDIVSLINDKKLSHDKVKISTSVVAVQKMNQLYNCADIFVSASGGEGFGLPFAEAMMAGLPILVPDFTTGPEFVEGKAGELIKVAEYIHEGPLSIRKAIIDTNDFAEKLEHLYLDWKSGGHRLKSLGENAREVALAKFSVQSIVRDWDRTIKEVQRELTLKSIHVSKLAREQREVIFIDDLPPTSWIGGTQLSTQRILDSAKDFGINAKCITLEECDLKSLYAADVVVLNNIHETAKRSPGLIEEIVSNLNYIKWEHDFNFCDTRDFRCRNKSVECSAACKKDLFKDIYAGAKSLIFQSPLHHKAFREHYGDKVITDYMILPPPVDPGIFIDAKENAKNRERRYLWSGLFHPFRGIDKAIQYAEQNPHKRFLFHTAYQPSNPKYIEQLKALPNCELLVKEIPYAEMPALFSSCTDFFYEPEHIDASSRTTLEAYLSGCRIRPNDNVGLMSYDWNWTNQDEVVETLKNAPRSFWEHVNKFIGKEETKIRHAKKVNIVFFPSGSSEGRHLPSSHIRVYRVSEELKQLGYDVQVIDSTIPDEIKYNTLSNLRSNDVVYVQKTFSEFNRAKNFKHIKGNNVIIYDVDDYYPERNEKRDIQHMFNSDAMSRLADMVIVGSHRLAQWNTKNNRNVRVIASLVDDNVYKYKSRKIKAPSEIKILWTEKDGSEYIDDLLTIKKPLEQIYRTYGCQIILQSFKPNEIAEVQELFPFARILPEVGFKEYISERVPMMQDCDFYIAPFSSKIEHVYKAGQNSRHIMAMGVPGVASPTAEHDHFISHGNNGFLANTEKEWYECMEKLVTDSNLRIQMGVKSRETVDQKYTIDKTLRQVIEAINSIKFKYYRPSIEVENDSTYRAFVTIKDRSTGGGTLTSRHIRDILENIGYKTQLLYCGPHKGSQSQTFIHQINEQRLKTPVLLRDYAKKYPVDAIYFDDVQRFDVEVAKTIPQSFLVLCGCANVHTEYYTDPMLLNGAPHVKRVFVKNHCLYKYLNSLFGDKFVYWQGGIDAQKLRNQYGRAVYRHPRDGALLTSAFFASSSSAVWWKNPVMASLAAYAVYRKYPKTRYFKPVLTEEDRAFINHTHFPIQGNTGQMPREQLLETLVKSQIGLEVYLADAFPRTLLDYFALGIPMIVSDAISFLGDFPLLQDHLVVSNANDPLQITQKTLTLLENQEKWEMVSATCIEFTKQYSFQAESDVLLKYSNIKIPQGREIPRLDSSHLLLDENVVNA